MSTAMPIGTGAVKSDSSPSPFHMRSWCGMNVSAWLRVLARNRFDVPPIGWPMAAIISLFSVGNSVLGGAQRLLYSRRIARTELTAPPVFVIGHWRSGTTLLHELLAADPRHTCPNTYTCFGCNHFLLTERWLQHLLFSWLRPSHRPMDNMEVRWESPQEDEWALCNMGIRSPYFTCLFPNREPQDQAYLDLKSLSSQDRQRWKDALNYFLKCLTVREPKRIILKTPLHTARIAILREMFPDAKFVHIARNPFVVFPSSIHTWKRLYEYQGIQRPRFDGLEEFVLDTFTRMYAAFDEDVKELPAGQLHEIRYEDLIARPERELESIYDRLELGDFEPARPSVQQYSKSASAYKVNRYSVSPEIRAAIQSRWKGYIDRYGYSNE